VAALPWSLLGKNLIYARFFLFNTGRWIAASLNSAMLPLLHKTTDIKTPFFQTLK
jgi:hypothetical protein